jgi:ribosomal-protein-alanine N-acetyltransferase
MTVKLPISAPRLLLRQFTPADVEKVFLMSREDGMRTWIPCQVYRDEAHVAQVLERLISHYETGGDPRRGPFVLGVELAANGELVGHVGLSRFEDEVEIGYAIETACQRRGLASEASRALCRWAMNQFQLDSILGITDALNLASQRVLLRSGFVFDREDTIEFQGAPDTAVRIYRYCRVPRPARGS